MTGVVVGAAAAALVALFGTPLVEKFLRARGIGQPIHEDVTQHAHKAGTPTMGGVILVVSLIVGYAVARLTVWSAPSAGGSAVVAVTLAGGAIGAVDDWLKVKSRHNQGGLSRRAKSALQVPVMLVFCGWLLQSQPCHAAALTRCGTGIVLPPALWLLFAVAFFWATTNAVNFGDGIEGLLAGSGAVTLSALLLVAFWQFRHPELYGVHDALDYAVIAACLTAACTGFLWWNVNPMSIFMGDVGSLAIGSAIAALALSMDITLLMVALGAVYLVELASSGLQIYTWRWYFKPRGASRRLFRMAPIHHHFEVVGWSEGTILVRFWILHALAAAIALGIFYADALKAL